MSAAWPQALRDTLKALEKPLENAPGTISHCSILIEAATNARARIAAVWAIFHSDRVGSAGIGRLMSLMGIRSGIRSESKSRSRAHNPVAPRFAGRRGLPSTDSA